MYLFIYVDDDATARMDRTNSQRDAKTFFNLKYLNNVLN